MRAAAIVLMCVGAAITYGVLHDLVTAHVCVEYFTIGHPPVFPTENPVWLALGWGVLATWWVGLILGWGLVIAACAGGRPPRSVRSLVRPVALLMVVSGACAVAMGIVGYFVAEAGGVVLLQPLAAEVSAEKHTRFLADLWAHTTSYAVGFGGGTIVLVRVWRSRKAA